MAKSDPPHDRAHAVFRWAGVYFRTGDPQDPRAPVEYLDGLTWKTSDLLAGTLADLGAARLSEAEVLELGLPGG